MITPPIHGTPRNPASEGFGARHDSSSDCRRSPSGLCRATWHHQHAVRHERCGAGKTGTEAVKLARKLAPDVILMDLRMPEMSGVDVIRAIRAGRPDTAVIVLTTYQGDEDIRKALAAGAQAYLVKGMSSQIDRGDPSGSSGQSILSPQHSQHRAAESKPVGLESS